jgi:predicted dehydrogenase
MLTDSSLRSPISRRNFLINASGTAAITLASPAIYSHAQRASTAFETIQGLGRANTVQLSQIYGSSEKDEKAPGPFLPQNSRIGYAIVGLGRLSINQILPAFGASKYCRPTALVSGDRAKALKIAGQYGIPDSSVYDYRDYELLASNPNVHVIYIVLPNGMHEEYVVRGAKTGKHILCEKPMANSAAEAERMIDACTKANIKLMIAYRQQYEPNNKAVRKLVTQGKLGQLRGFISTNSQQMGDPTHWRLKKSLSGGGCLPDVGIYCINASRFISGREPTRVTAQLWQPKDDPRFAEVEASVSFSMYFPSGFVAACSTSYDIHKSQSFRLEGTDMWAEMSPAYAYHGIRLKVSRLEDGQEISAQPEIEDRDQFALEMDHFADCIITNQRPHTPGEEGLQDHRVIEAIYEAARSGKAVELPEPLVPTRGPLANKDS